jgi:dTDP-4-amino-4,6-dideoxy-D-galactose acyltransferase
MIWATTSGKITQAAFGLVKLEWESAILKEPRYGLKWAAGRSWSSLRKAVLSFPGVFEMIGAASVFIRLPMSSHRFIQALEGSGFSYVGGLSTLRMKRLNPSPRQDKTLLRTAQARDTAQLRMIAHIAFEEGRFYNEPGLSSEGAKKIYGEWARNSVKGGYANEVIVAVKDKVLGFVTLKDEKKNRILWIDLIAVSPAAQGQGVGSLLVAESWKRVEALKDYTLGVKTQTENLGALRFYMRNGFEPEPFKLDYVWRK